VQGGADVLGEDQLAAVDRALAGEHPQQRRLARAIAPGQRQPIPALEPERDAPEQGLPHHVLGEVGCEDDGHQMIDRAVRAAPRTWIVDAGRHPPKGPVGSATIPLRRAPAGAARQLRGVVGAVRSVI
jgi:hypothetical protein